MKLVFDTNVLISALVFRGLPGQLLLYLETGNHELFSSPELLAELEDALSRPKFIQALASSGTSAERLFDDFLAVPSIIQAPPLPQPVSRDPDDDAVLACAIAAQAGLIVSGDRDLLVLQHFQGIPIVTAAQALARLQREAPN